MPTILHFPRRLLSLLALAAFMPAAALAVPPLPLAPPHEVGMDAARLERIPALVHEAIDTGDLPGCVVLIARHGKVVWYRALGHRQLLPTPEPMTVDTVFDLASLTKPVATATSVMLLVERGALRLGDAVADHIEEFAQNGKQEITVLQLLTHQAGFVPDNPLADYADQAQIWPRLWALKTVYEPGREFVYSDVGFQIAGGLVEQVSGDSLSAFAEREIFGPLGMDDTGFCPSPEVRPRIAPTEQRDGDWIRGEVHDPRAWAMGGVAGHAGLFSTAMDLARYAEMLHGGGMYEGQRVMGPQTVREMTRPHRVAKRKRAVGWDVQSTYSTNRGELFSDRAFGHGGFTGTAMWLDPTLHLTVIFLSNRLHPDGKGSVNRLAGRIGTIAAGSAVSDSPAVAVSPAVAASLRDADQDALQAHMPPHASSAPHQVLTGIDVLQRDAFRQLAGRRVGLITNHTGVNRAGVRTAELLAADNRVELVALFSPEHGLEGKRDDNRIQDTRDESADLPVYSLYGPRRSPTKEQLEGIDTLVFDIQDIGTRFYTYVSTMGLAMEAAADSKVRFVVLDRPNPIGSVEVSGPLLDPERESFVGFHKLPVRHGMTIGELACMFRDERQLQLDLEIVPSEGWSRSQLWDATGLPWINPSPNMRNLNQALLYPGIGLLETTNLSVGRGTDTPFEIIGAPWLDGPRAAALLNAADTPGMRFVPTRFVPAASKFTGESCGGVQLLIVDRKLVHPVRLGIQVASVLWQLHADEWNIDLMDRLLCHQQTLSALKAGTDVDAICARWEDGLAQFRSRRSPFLLYGD